MIAHIEGDLTYKCPTHVILECNGIGYQINISLYTYNKISNLNKAKLLTYLHVKEDAHTLYGFAEESEKQVFVSLISVSGIGPNTARTILSSISSQELHNAIINENVVILEGIKGIGAKSAKRMILELKDKFGKQDIETSISGVDGNNIKKEALSALVMLGYNRSSAEQTVNKILSVNKESITVEELIKIALKSI